MVLANYSDEELQREMIRRNGRPNELMLSHTSHAKTIQAVRNYIDFLASEDYHSDRMDDYKQYIFEEAVEALYGEDIWDDYINKLEV